MRECSERGLEGPPCSDRQFRADFELGLQAERLIAVDLLRLGFVIHHPIPGFVEGYKPGTFPATASDLEVGRDWTLRFGLEIKSTGIAFEGPDDFPRPRVWVGSVSGWVKRADDPAAVVVVSRATGGRLVVPAYIRQLCTWEVPVPDRRPVYAAPRAAWRSWDWLTGWLTTA